MAASARAVSHVAPDLAGRIGAELFSWTPSPHDARPDERDTIAAGRPFHLTVDGRRVRGWSWGAGPTVLLVHGWGGRGGQLHRMVWPLVARGLRVVAFDAPGHGSSGGRRSTLPLFARAARAVADQAGGQLAAVIAHSLGAAATVLALRQGLRAERVVLLAPAAHPRDHFRAFLGYLGVSGDALARSEARVERALGVTFADVDLVANAPSAGVPALILHDRDDREIALAHGEAVACAWPGARFIATSDLGHQRLLADSAVIDHVVEFAAGTAHLGATDEAALFERELFTPSLRWANAADVPLANAA